jgi:glycosyltransferase involved in cell wall biosynthesis
MPLYNRERMVGSALRSLLRPAEAADLEVIVVDDGSSDGSAAAVRSIGRQDGRVRLVSQAHAGVTVARNRGLRELHRDAKLVTFLDSDDISPAGRIARDLKYFRNDRDLDVVYGRMMLVDAIDDGRLLPAEGCRSVTVRGVSLSAGIFRRQWCDRLGGFDEEFAGAEDTDFLFRLFELSPKTLLTDTVSVIYRRHAGNLTKQTELMRRSVMLALHKSIKRRRADPGLAPLKDIFDINALRDVRWL